MVEEERRREGKLSEEIKKDPTRLIESGFSNPDLWSHSTPLAYLHFAHPMFILFSMSISNLLFSSMFDPRYINIYHNVVLSCLQFDQINFCTLQTQKLALRCIYH